MDRGGDSYLYDRNRMIQGITPPRVNGTEKRELARENVSPTPVPTAHQTPQKSLGELSEIMHRKAFSELQLTI